MKIKNFTQLDKWDMEELADLFSSDLEKVSVILNHTYDFEPPKYISEFVGKTGTLTRCEFWGSYQATVELDTPHSEFGDFGRCIYLNRHREVVYEVISGSLTKFFNQCQLLDTLFHWPFYKDPDATDCTFEDMQERWETAKTLWKKRLTN